MENQIIMEITKVLDEIKRLQQIYLNEVLNLEFVLNYSYKTNPIRHESKREQQNNKKEDKIHETSKEEVENKIDELLNQVDIQRKYLQSEVKQKPKFQSPKIQTPIEKKPPVPTANRAPVGNSAKGFVPKYVPPRNKNEVTLKVTQTIIRSDKVFRPEKSNSVLRPEGKSQMQRIAQAKMSASKQGNRSVEKKIEVNRPIVISKGSEDKILVSKAPEVKIESKAPPKVQQKLPVNKTNQLKPSHDVGRVKSDKNILLAPLRRPIEEILEEIASKKMKSRKNILSKMIEECLGEQLGHRGKEQKSRELFVKHFANLCATKSRLRSSVSHSIPKRVWTGCPYAFQFNFFLQDLEKEILEMINYIDCKADPKQQYRIQCKSKMLTNELQKILEQSQSEVPQQIELNFTHNQIQQEKPQEEDIKETKFQVNEQNLSQKFLDMLEELVNSNILNSTALSKIRVLSQIAIYNSKRSPVIIKTEEYSKWRQYYE